MYIKIDNISFSFSLFELKNEKSCFFELFLYDSKNLAVLQYYEIMKIKDAVFLKSISINDDKVFFEQRKEIVFVGRSNVGKSSLMNALMNKKDLVKTSSKPGKTRNANMFLVNEKYYFTDLPGYWFAKLGQSLREDLDALISWYLEEKRHSIRQVILVCDTKIWPQQTDIDMYNYISELKLPVTVILAKIDRLGLNDINKSKFHTEKIFFGARVLPVSSSKLDGIEKLRKILWEALTQKDENK